MDRLRKECESLEKNRSVSNRFLSLWFLVVCAFSWRGGRFLRLSAAHGLEAVAAVEGWKQKKSEKLQASWGKVSGGRAASAGWVLRVFPEGERLWG